MDNKKSNIDSIESNQIMLDFEKGKGLIPVIVQDSKTFEVLMLAYMNKEAWKNSLKTGKATYFSRSRKKLWVKGESSGNFQLIQEIRIDCDNDTILLKVKQKGGACHKGYKNCFFQKVDGNKIIVDREKLFDPNSVYKGE